MSSPPGNIDKVVRQFKRATTELTNDQIVMIAGGSIEEWGEYLKGPKVQSIIRCANLILVQENYEIVSSGIGSQRWRMVRCAEARVEQAHQQTRKASNHVRNAEENMWAVAKDERAPKTLREDAIAWLQLFHDEKQAKNLLVFEEWAAELVGKFPSTQKQLEAATP